ncbi:MAG TPA: DNA primase [Aggregatilinea sp.]|uniref:DNA primase n=1 Tax=Aggregatilinea sp. TaxID=2806333 RepID=UPI002C945756|nr:DNA primase [Aggregatilinea sp.]HML24080.1 DNA primase [Aggregatilinea sp.]
MSVVDDVKARLDIVDVVSGYTNLHKAGRNYKALCPFHQERTPSFIVFPDTQTWRCFGACGEGGDIFSFVMKAEGWDFPETLRILAERAGVELQPFTPQQIERQEANDRLLGLLNEAAHFFHTQLLESRAAQGARDYVARRGLNAETVEAFNIGYAPDDWRQALQHLQMLGYTQDEVVEAGVAILNEEKGSIYDRFRHRLMIPIRDERGRTVGFGARGLDKDAVPKYLNSPQGPLFDKSRLLYGLDMARRAIRETETVVVVEGYMDAIQAHQAGFHNVVAQMGTALTEDQLRQLDKYATRLILALDPDAAGANATLRGLDVARQTLEDDEAVTFDPRGIMRYTGTVNMDLRVVTLPDGLDPDDLIRENPGAWEQLIERAVPVAVYVIEQGTAHLNSQSSYYEREAAARKLLPLLTATESDFQRNVNIQALARRVRIDERTLIEWTQRRRVSKTRTAPSIRQQRRLADRPPDRTPAVGGAPGQSAFWEGFCLYHLLQQPEQLFAANRKLRELQGGDDALAEALRPLGPEDFTQPEYQIIFKYLDTSLYQDEDDPLDYLYRHLPPELIPVVNELEASPLDRLEQGLSGSLRTELQSVLREQARLSMTPDLNADHLIQEALTLRHSRIERELNELYFLQEDALAQGDNLTEWDYQATVEANRRARERIAKALHQMKHFARNV